MPPLFEREETRERLKKLPGGPTQPLTVHLRQEIDRLNVVLATTKATLTDLRLAISGAGPGAARHRGGGPALTISLRRCLGSAAARVRASWDGTQVLAMA